MSDIPHNPDEDMFATQPGGPDPRMSKEYTSSILHPKGDPRMLSQGAAIGRQANRNDGPADTSSSMSNLLARLEGVNSYAAEIHGHIINLNDGLGGSTPQESTDKTHDAPKGALNYAHILVDDINSRLLKIEHEHRRLSQLLGG